MKPFHIILPLLITCFLTIGHVSAQTDEETSLENYSEGDTTGEKVAVLRNIGPLDYTAERRNGTIVLSIDVKNTGTPESVYFKLGTTPVKPDLLRKRITEDVLNGIVTDKQVSILQNNDKAYLVLEIKGFEEHEPGLYFIEIILRTKEPKTFREKQEIFFYPNEL